MKEEPKNREVFIIKGMIIFMLITSVMVYLVIAVVEGLNSLKWSGGYKDAFVGINLLFFFFCFMGCIMAVSPGPRNEK